VIVLDASVLASLIADNGVGGELARAALTRARAASVPDLADVETAAVLRKRWIAGDLSDEQCDLALADLRDLAIERYPARPLLSRAFELRANLTVYDAVYVALAEALACTLVTADARLAGAPGIACPIDLLV
jgi:predicted nucleic acid-binding protein